MVVKKKIAFKGFDLAGHLEHGKKRQSAKSNRKFLDERRNWSRRDISVLTLPCDKEDADMQSRWGYKLSFLYKNVAFYIS